MIDFLRQIASPESVQLLATAMLILFGFALVMEILRLPQPRHPGRELRPAVRVAEIDDITLARQRRVAREAERLHTHHTSTRAMHSHTGAQRRAVARGRSYASRSRRQTWA